MKYVLLTLVICNLSCAQRMDPSMSAEALNYLAGCIDGLYWLSGSMNIADNTEVQQVEGQCYDMTKKRFNK